jgi:subtilisin family serine protease
MKNFILSLRSILRGPSLSARPSPFGPRWRPSIESLEERLAPSVAGLGDDVTGQATIQSQFANASFGPLIGLSPAQANYPYRGDGYSVAVLDTGIDYNDPSLGGGWGKRVIAGWNFVNNTSDPMDDNGHGSHVAGIIGSSSTQYPGVAPDVNLIALKVLDANANGTWTTIDAGLQWVIAHQAQYNIVAVNLSLGSGNYTTPPAVSLDNDLATLNQDGLFISVASGNNYYTYQGAPGLAYPAANPNVVSVGAVWTGNYPEQVWSSGAIDYAPAPDQIVSITQRDSNLSLLAPGAWIDSTWNDGGFATLGGTSMAAAVVTGAAVLLHQAYDAKGEHSLTTEASLLHVMRQTGATIVDNVQGTTNVPTSGLSFQRLDLLAALNAIGPAAQAPVFAPLANISLPAGGTAQVALSATDALPVTFTATILDAATLAYQLKQQLGLTYPGSYYVNMDGANEKWLTGSGGAWYCILPDGEFRRWAGTMPPTLQAANLLATLDSSFYADPSKLWNAAPASALPASPVSVTIHGNQLTVGTTATFTGTYTVQVNAHAGQLSSSQTFTIMAVNVPPVLAALANQTVTHGHSLTLTLKGSDANPLQYSAALAPGTIGTPATLSVTGNQLTIATTANFVGAFTIQATASDGTLSASQSFSVQVTNTAPVLGALATQTLAGPLTVALPGSDVDGDALTFSAQVLPASSSLYLLEQQLQLQPFNHSYYTNLWGLGEKWLVGANEQWYCLLPTGQLYRWAGTIPATMEPANLVASLGTAIYADPTLLWQAQPQQAPPVTLAIQGNQLTITPQGPFTGTFTVQVTVSDGLASAVGTFTVNGTNIAPGLAAIANQSLAAGQTSLSVPLTASDPDGDTLATSAQVMTPAANLYQLNQQLHLQPPNGSYYTNLWGLGEKWLEGANEQWYFLVPTGTLYHWAGNIPASLQSAAANLGTAVYAEPRLLWQAQPPQAPALTVTIQGGKLSIQRPANLVGVFVVQVTVSDSQTTATQSFQLALG